MKMYIKYFGETKHYCQIIGETEICSLSENGLRETVKTFGIIYAEDCMEDLLKQIRKWRESGMESVEISMTDLALMQEHIEDLEMENGNVPL